jgi:hypothetical protein
MEKGMSRSWRSGHASPYPLLSIGAEAGQEEQESHEPQHIKPKQGSSQYQHCTAKETDQRQEAPLPTPVSPRLSTSFLPLPNL